jgi:hypothetical protein
LALLNWRNILKFRNLRYASAWLGLTAASAAHAVTIDDVSVTTTTGTYTSPLAPLDTTGEGYTLIGDEGIEIESVADIIPAGTTSVVRFTYTVTADAGDVITSAEVTPGMYLYDATGKILVGHLGTYYSLDSFSDDGLGNGTTIGAYSIGLGSGYTSFTVSGFYSMSTVTSTNIFAEGYADHLSVTFDETPGTQTATPGPLGLLPFAAGLFSTVLRRRMK